jgi:hypothetical protein
MNEDFNSFKHLEYHNGYNYQNKEGREDSEDRAYENKPTIVEKINML